MSVTLKTAPATEPVTVLEAKNQMRVTHADEDGLIGNYITAARQAAETFTNRQFITATWELRLDEFPECIRLPFPPALVVNTIKYYDTGGTLTTMLPADYREDIYEATARIDPAFGKTWPPTRAQSMAVIVDYDAGYGLTASTVPMGLRQAILWLVAHWFEHREPILYGASQHKIPFHVESLLWQYKVPAFA